MIFYVNLTVDCYYCITIYANLTGVWRNVCIFAGKQVTLGNQANVAFFYNLYNLLIKTYRQ